MARTPTSNDDGAVDANADVTQTPAGKGHATPTRREREAANLKPLVQSDRKAANQAARAKATESREKARIGMANGDERYLPLRDKGPQRRYLRDYVDARFSIGELMIPVMFLVILTTFVPGIEVYSFLVLWLFFILAVADAVILGHIVVRKIKTKFGDDNVQSGTRWYAAMRAMQLRPMRLPKPQVKRRAYPA